METEAKQKYSRGDEQLSDRPQIGGQAVGRAPTPLPPSFTISATDAGAPELVLAWMQSNFHRLNDASLYQTLGQAIEMRNFRFR